MPPMANASQAAALNFSNAELFKRSRSRSPEAACRRICSAISSGVADFLTKKRRSIHDHVVQRLPHDGDRRGIVFLFHINHRRRPIVGCVIEFFCKGLMNRAIAMTGPMVNPLVADDPCPLLIA